MPEAAIRGVQIVYRTFGDAGPWIALSPGSRRSHAELVPIAEKLADRGFRVLLHDRRNCGASSVGIEYRGSENEMWADDLHELAGQLGALPMHVGGSSSGARLALLFALRHPDATSGLLLWRLTGGGSTVELAHAYYGAFIDIAREGGMEAVCRSDHFAACIKARPENRDRLMNQSVDAFIDVMTRWRDDFLKSAALPVIGATEEQLRSLIVPTLLAPGADRIHAPETAHQLRGLIPNSRLAHIVEPLPPEQRPDEWQDQWAGKESAIAQLLGDFLTTGAGE